MKCFICDNYFIASRWDKSRASGASDISGVTCTECSTLTDTSYYYDPDVEAELGILRNTGRVLPVFDDSDGDDSHGF